MTDPWLNSDISNDRSHVLLVITLVQSRKKRELEKPIEFGVWKVLYIFQRRKVEFQTVKFEVMS